MTKKEIEERYNKQMNKGVTMFEKEAKEYATRPVLYGTHTWKEIVLPKESEKK